MGGSSSGAAVFGCQSLDSRGLGARLPAVIRGARDASGLQRRSLAAALGAPLPGGLALAQALECVLRRGVVDTKTAIRGNAQRVDLQGSAAFLVCDATTGEPPPRPGERRGASSSPRSLRSLRGGRGRSPYPNRAETTTPSRRIKVSHVSEPGHLSRSPGRGEFRRGRNDEQGRCGCHRRSAGSGCQWRAGWAPRVNGARLRYGVADLLRHRVFVTALGCEELNDHAVRHALAL